MSNNYSKRINIEHIAFGMQTIWLVWLTVWLYDTVSDQVAKINWNFASKLRKAFKQKPEHKLTLNTPKHLITCNDTARYKELSDTAYIKKSLIIFLFETGNWDTQTIWSIYGNTILCYSYTITIPIGIVYIAKCHTMFIQT